MVIGFELWRVDEKESPRRGGALLLFNWSHRGCAFHKIDSMLTVGLIVITLTTVGNDIAVCCIQSPTPLAVCILIQKEKHNENLSR